MADKLCEFCGKPFVMNTNSRGGGNRKYCSETCRDKNELARRVKTMRRSRASKRNRPLVVDGLTKAMIEADRLGLSYGQYMARVHDA